MVNNKDLGFENSYFKAQLSKGVFKVDVVKEKSNGNLQAQD